MIRQCKRCGRRFDTNTTAWKRKDAKCCVQCQCRNLFDALDMPTPPELLDRHTKHPTLTQAEFLKKTSDFEP